MRIKIISVKKECKIKNEFFKKFLNILFKFRKIHILKTNNIEVLELPYPLCFNNTYNQKQEKMIIKSLDKLIKKDDYLVLTNSLSKHRIVCELKNKYTTSICDGVNLFKFNLKYILDILSYSTIKKDLSAFSVVVMIDNPSCLDFEIVSNIANSIRCLTIITSYSPRIKKFVHQIYLNTGMNIKVTNSTKYGLKQSDVIINFGSKIFLKMNKSNIKQDSVLIDITQSANLSDKYRCTVIKNIALSLPPNIHLVEEIADDINCIALLDAYMKDSNIILYSQKEYDKVFDGFNGLVKIYGLRGELNLTKLM